MLAEAGVIGSRPLADSKRWAACAVGNDEASL
jgi:hypothetical protein